MYCQYLQYSYETPSLMATSSECIVQGDISPLFIIGAEKYEEDVQRPQFPLNMGHMLAVES